MNKINKIVITCFLVSASTSSIAFAAQNRIDLAAHLTKSGFVGQTDNKSQSGLVNQNDYKSLSIKDIFASSFDDQNVIVEGYIKKEIKSNRYILSDGTGEIEIKIKPKHMPVTNFDTKVLVRVHAEVEKKCDSTMLESEKLIELVKEKTKS